MMDIDKLEAGRELDALVAERVMGWRVDKEKYFTWVTFTDTCCIRPLVGTTKGCWGNWSPSTDIAAALPVLDWLRNQYFSTKIILWDHTDKVAIVCHKRQGHNENLGDLEVEAVSLSLAICRAALKATESE